MNYRRYSRCNGVCSHCMGETFNILPTMISLFAHIHAGLFPCAVCGYAYGWHYDIFGCHGFTRSNEHTREHTADGIYNTFKD